jgi:hypothetical protein
MKQGLAVLVVIVVIAAVGFGGFWIGRAGAPTASAGNEIAVSPAVAQSTSSVSAQAALPPIPEQEKIAPKRLQSSYVPQGGTSAQASTATPSDKNSDQPKKNGRPATELIAEIETDDPKSVFQNPAVAAHQALLNETPDPDWSQIAAQQLRDYLAAQLGNRFECLAEDLTGEAKHKLSTLTGKLVKDPTYSVSDSERIIDILRNAREDLVVLKKGESALKLTSLSRQLWSVVRRQ